ncbi:hypothetical protein J4209_02105 [Candidatus Woesearchaeota archaeon]|nr:hypothetical protein [Candidatus Woesearchaeota archaeon]
MADPGAEEIILDRLEPAFYCFSCKIEMNNTAKNTYECPICKHVYKKGTYLGS